MSAHMPNVEPFIYYIGAERRRKNPPSG